jgi:predicted Zn-dependent peptidase
LSFKTPVSWPDPGVETFSLENGIRCFLIQDSELPLIQVRVSVRAGEFLVPREKAGVARITGEVMRNGGSIALPGKKLNALLAEKAARLEIGFGFISGTAEMGLAYSVSGQFGCNYFYPGLFYVELQTRTPATAEAVHAVKKVLQQLQKGVGPEELDQVRDQFFNCLVFRYDRVEKILERRMQHVFRGMAPDSFQKLVQEIREVDTGDVGRVAHTYLKPDRLTVVAVGKEKAIADQLEKLGRVTVLARP